MEKVLFQEEQRFKQWWIWLLIIFILLAVIIPLFNAIAKEQTALNSSGTARLILYGVLAVLFLTAVLIIMLFIKLKTKITDKGIYIAYFPFIRKWKKFAVEEIENYEIRKYRAMLEYGGYGMKNQRKSGRAYSISGDIGLQLYMKNGKKLLIGTQKKQAMEYAMAKLMGTEKQYVSVNKINQEAQSLVKGKIKKILIIIAIEVAIIILILSMIQIFK